MKLGIIGNGFVGKASTQLACDEIEVIAYDTRPEACSPLGTTLIDLLPCDVVMISVPTPMQSNGECYTDIARSVIAKLKELNYMGIMVLRSTVPVGTCDDLGVFFMPEFLTERNFMQDFFDNPDWIFGIYDSCTDWDREHFQSTMTKLFETAEEYGCISTSNMHFVSAREAEMVKMARNCFLALKTSFCNEIYRFCQSQNIDYSNVRELFVKDARIGASHSRVPGPDGRFGFGGTCFPKDLSSLCYEMKRAGVEGVIVNAVKFRNETIDRPEHDWELDKGRAVVETEKQKKE